MSLHGGLIQLADATTAPAGPAGPGLPSTAEAFKQVVETSVLGALLVIAIAAIGAMWLLIWRRQNSHEAELKARDAAHDAALKDIRDGHTRERSEWEAQLGTLQESRLSLLREVMTALGNSTAAIGMQTASTAERTASAQALTQKISELINSQGTRLDFMQRSLDDLSRSGQANAESLQRLSYAVKAG